MKIRYLAMLVFLFGGLLIVSGCDRDEEPEEMPADEPEASEVEMGEYEAPVETVPRVRPTKLGLINIAQPYPNVITSGQPTEEDFLEFEEAGVKTVINLRHSDEEGFWDPTEKAEELGLAYVHIPIEGIDDMTAENIELLHDALEEGEGNFLIYSATSDRVGAMVAFREDSLLDATVLRALQRGKAAGLDDLDESVRDRLYRQK